MRTIRFAFVGFGNIAKTHMVALKALPLIKKLPYTPVLDTLITRDPEGNRAAAEAAGFVHVSSSLEEALSQRDIDVVDICTPNSLHLETVLTSARAGKSIYCEKPLTENYSRSVELTEAAAASQGIHQTALVYRYHPAVVRMKELLRSGLIGQVLQAKLSYRRSGYLNAERPVSWRLDEALTGGGAITDLGVHVVDLARYLAGEIDSADGKVHTFVKSRPKDASGSGERVEIHVDDWAMMFLEHATGVRTTAEVSRIAWGSEAFQVDLIGSKGAISCDLEKDYMPRIKLLDGSSPAIPSPSALSLCTDEKSTMGMSVDCHLASLNHYLHRLAGEDRWDAGLAPTLEDCLKAEYWIDRVLRQNGRAG